MKVAVIGAGSWGTALANVVAHMGHNVNLWARREEVARAVNSTHCNSSYLPGVILSKCVIATNSLSEVLSNAQAVLLVTPSQYMRETAESMYSCCSLQGIPTLVCSKGVEAETGLLPVQILEEIGGNRESLAALAGPNHAEEVVRGIPSGTVVASISFDIAYFFQSLLGSESFRVYTSNDIIGVEICAAFKNIIAIAVGMAYGLGCGDNTAAMLMTRGQAEMSRLVVAAGGEALTCMGLAGTGDLIATCMSRYSRNRMFGEAFANGESLKEYEARRGMVVEGAQACKTIATLAKRYCVELPITDVVRAVIWEGANLKMLSSSLAERPQKTEF